MATKSIEAELSFVVRNLETGEDSRWIELHRMDEEMVEEIWNSVVDPRFDWEIVDMESNFSLDYYEYQYAPLEALMEAFEILQNAARFDDDALALEAALQEGDSIFEAADRAQDAIVIEVDGDTLFELGLAYVEMLGGIEDLVQPEQYFDFEFFGRDLRMSGFVSEMEEDNPEMAEELMDMLDDELGEWYVENFYGNESELPTEMIEQHFDYDQLGRDLRFDFTYVELEGIEAQVRLG